MGIMGGVGLAAIATFGSTLAVGFISVELCATEKDGVSCRTVRCSWVSGVVVEEILMVKAWEI
jgi:hypothetical protein